MQKISVSVDPIGVTNYGGRPLETPQHSVQIAEDMRPPPLQRGVLASCVPYIWIMSDEAPVAVALMVPQVSPVNAQGSSPCQLARVLLGSTLMPFLKAVIASTTGMIQRDGQQDLPSFHRIGSLNCQWILEGTASSQTEELESKSKSVVAFKSDVLVRITPPPHSDRTEESNWSKSRPGQSKMYIVIPCPSYIL
jgi:hypothetical protein